MLRKVGGYVPKFALEVVNPEIPTESLRFLCYIGSIYEEKNEYSKALEVYEEALKILKEYSKKVIPFYSIPEILSKLADLQLKIQDYPASEHHARQSLAIDSTQVDVRIKLAHSLLFQSRYLEAESIYKELLTLPAAETDKTNAQMILDDFDELEKAGVIPEDRKGEVERIRKLMNSE